MEDLSIKKYAEEHKRDFYNWAKNKEFTTSKHPNFKVGQKITFYGGYNEDIHFKTEILGFNKDGEIFVLWDCYWFPIRDEEKRKINIIK